MTYGTLLQLLTRKCLKKIFTNEPVNLIADNVLDGLSIYITSLKYLENRLFWFFKLPDSSIEEKNRQLMGLDK